MNPLHKVYLFFADIAQTLVLAGAIFIVIYAFFFRPFQVNGASMEPTFHDKEYILTDLITKNFQELKQGDVIVFKAPIDEEKDFIKRIIGMPHDIISVKDGSVFINNKNLDESAYLSSTVKTYGGSFLKDGTEITVPASSYFVMGDNRSYSSDSREWGFVSKDIIGKSWIVYWPLSDFKIVKNPYYQ